MSLHVPQPSLVPHVCTCGADFKDPRYHVSMVEERVPPTRRGDPETSFEAAKSVKNPRKTQAQVLDIISEHGPMTDEQVALWYKARNYPKPQSPSGLRTRRKELVDMGLLKNTGRTVIGQTGRKMTVWGIK